MKDFYINRIQEKMKDNQAEYEETLKEVFGEIIPFEALKEASSDQQIDVMCELDRKIRLKESRIDIELMARAIQHSRSGAGLCAMTDYTCAFCGKTETWGSSAVPKICYSCAKKMATNMAISNPKMLKTDREN